MRSIIIKTKPVYNLYKISTIVDNTGDWNVGAVYNLYKISTIVDNKVANSVELSL